MVIGFLFDIGSLGFSFESYSKSITINKCESIWHVSARSYFQIIWLLSPASRHLLMSIGVLWGLLRPF